VLWSIIQASETQKKIKTIRYFTFFLNFDLAEGGTSALLASPLVLPLTVWCIIQNEKS